MGPEARPDVTDGDLRLRLPSGLNGNVPFDGIVSSATASRFPGRIDSIEPVFLRPNGDVGTEILATSSCMLATLSCIFAMSWSHCGIVSCRKVNALVMSDMLGKLVVRCKPS